VVFNPLGWERSGDVTVKVHIDSGHYVRFHLKEDDGMKGGGPETESIKSTFLDKASGTAELKIHVVDVPALANKVLQVQAVSSDMLVGSELFAVYTKENADSFTIDQRLLTVTVNKSTGCITSLVDRQSGYEALAKGSCGNQLQFFKDTPKDYDAWNVDPGTFDVAPTTIDKADSVELLNAKADHPSIQVKFHRQNSTLVQTIKSISTTTSTGTNPTSSSKPLSRWQLQARSRRTKSPTAPSTAPPPATTVGRRRSSKFPRCAGPTWAMASTA
jgi:alpha-mannosidase